MTPDEMIAVIQAYKNGKKIQYVNYRCANSKWEDCDFPHWDFFSFKYRIKPESQTGPNRTREERAKDYALTCPPNEQTIAFTSYMFGATEQKTVDINKACSWLAEHNHSAETIGNITCTSVMTEGLLTEEFRKAMTK